MLFAQSYFLNKITEAQAEDQQLQQLRYKSVIKGHDDFSFSRDGLMRFRGKICINTK